MLFYPENLHSAQHTELRHVQQTGKAFNVLRVGLKMENVMFCISHSNQTVHAHAHTHTYKFIQLIQQRLIFCVVTHQCHTLSLPLFTINLLSMYHL